MAPREARAAADERVMGATALHRANTCLDDDTLRGLDALYPSCDVHTPAAAVAGQTTPSRGAACVHRVGAAGLARLLLIVAIPYASISLALVLLHTIVQRYTGRAQEALRRRAQKASWGCCGRALRVGPQVRRVQRPSAWAPAARARRAGAGGKQRGAVPKVSKASAPAWHRRFQRHAICPGAIGCHRGVAGFAVRSGRPRPRPSKSQNSAKLEKGGKQRAGGRAAINRPVTAPA